jgi:hypothetical protein
MVIRINSGVRTPYSPEPLPEAIAKKGFWFKIAAGPSFTPEEYSSILRI